MASLEQQITLTVQGKIAIITLNLPEKFNALSLDLYYYLSTLLRQVATRDDIYITVLTGKGRFFSAGADVKMSRAVPPGADIRRHWLTSFVANNLEVTNAFYTHPKILITALNGPVVGLSAALIAWSDFIYCAPHAFLLTPFSSLGLVTEGGSSRAFVQRMGISKANEALIMSKRITSEEMLVTGFVNKIFPTGKDEDEKFFGLVMQEVEERFGSHLNSESLLRIKALIRKPERDAMDGQGALEVFGGLERFAAGIPQEEFRKVASGEKKHKL
ncbi:hypothetical protein MMC34_006540 [Xylographa carneopallida]|nr:hypothetical protein [Xylographa carneopallida]